MRLVADCPAGFSLFHYTAAAAAAAGNVMMPMTLVQNNAIDILTKCDELRKQFMPLRWEVC